MPFFVFLFPLTIIIIVCVVVFFPPLLLLFVWTETNAGLDTQLSNCPHENKSQKKFLSAIDICRHECFFSLWSILASTFDRCFTHLLFLFSHSVCLSICIYALVVRLIDVQKKLEGEIRATFNWHNPKVNIFYVQHLT